MYFIFQSQDKDRLIEHINAAEKDGWKCQGGIAVDSIFNELGTRGLRETTFYQAMVKEDRGI